MKKKLTNNWLLKIASLVFAFCLWLIVINIEDPTNPQTFTNIPVKFENTEVLTDQGLVYEVLDGTSVVKSITVYGPRSIVAQLKEEDIVAKVDFNDLTNANTVPIEFSTSRFTDKITKIRGNISNVKLNVEKEKTIRLVLRVNAVGQVAEGYILGNMLPDQNQIIITGPESVINQIDKAIAEVDVTEATAGIATYADVKLLDKDGKRIESDAITQKVTSVRVSVEVLATKKVPIYYAMVGTPAKGYMATGELESDPAMVLLAGSNAALNSITKVNVPAEELDITGQSENLVETVNIKDYLPNNVSLADNSFDGKATVTVFIEPSVTKNFQIAEENIQLIGAPEGFEISVAELEGDTTLVLTGLAESINLIDTNNIVGYIDMQALKEEYDISEWKESQYEATLKFSFAEDIIIEKPIKVIIELIKMEE